MMALSLVAMAAAYSPTLPHIVASRAPARAARFAPLMSATGKMNPAQQISGLIKGDLSLQAVPDAEVGSPSIALCDPEACTEVVPSGTVHRAKVGSYFGVWFVLSIGYAVCNKRVTNALPLPWLVATSTVLVGSVFVSLLWKTGLRETPQLSRAQLWGLLPMGIFHAIGHAAGTLGTTYGSVSFAQVVKAAGPVYACALSAVVLRQAVSLRVWMSLLPIIGGVALATMKELSFAWGALIGAVVSDLALALRNVYSKQRMNKPPEERGELSPANMFSVLTVLSTLVSLPVALAIEGRIARPTWNAAVATMPGGAATLLTQICAAGLFFYGYSEVAMQALANVHPVTHAIGNTMRRVVIMVVSMVVFRTPMTPLGAAGSALAITGAFSYAMIRHAEKMAEKAQAEQPVHEQLADDPEGWDEPCDPWVPSFACIVGGLLPPFVTKAFLTPKAPAAPPAVTEAVKPKTR
jgi:solute carrier family 35 protein E1